MAFRGTTQRNIMSCWNSTSIANKNLKTRRLLLLKILQLMAELLDWKIVLQREKEQCFFTFCIVQIKSFLTLQKKTCFAVSALNCQTHNCAKNCHNVSTTKRKQIETINSSRWSSKHWTPNPTIFDSLLWAKADFSRHIILCHFETWFQIAATKEPH